MFAFFFGVVGACAREINLFFRSLLPYLFLFFLLVLVKLSHTHKPQLPQETGSGRLGLGSRFLRAYWSDWIPQGLFGKGVAVVGRKRIVRRSIKLTAWQQSEQFRQIGSAAITAWNKSRGQRPKCKATAKWTGERCGQAAMANGVCYYHGGLTPSGDGWHRPVWPNADAPDAEAKLARKLRDRERAAKKRSARIAKMAPAEREKHTRWSQAHTPGSARKRAAEKERRRQNAEAFLKGDEANPTPVDPACAELQRSIVELERRIAALSVDIFG